MSNQLLSRFLASKSDLLDPRMSESAEVDLIPGAVNIPYDELFKRVAELPPRGSTVRVFGEGFEAMAAISNLFSLGRNTVPAAQGRASETTSTDRRFRLWEPNSFLMDVLNELPPGGALDLACGSGRDAIAMAACGWKVTGVDLLPDALAMAARIWEHFGGQGSISWREVDLETNYPPDFSSFDLVTMFFFLDRSLVQHAISSLRPGASLVLETFTQEHRRQFGRPKNEHLALWPGELEAIGKGLDIRHLSEDLRPSGRHTARIWVRRLKA